MTKGRTKTTRALLALAVVVAAPHAWGAGGMYYIGDSSDNVLGGTTESDVMKGRGGADSLSGADGSDRIDGGPGSDTKLAGEGGADLLFGGQGTDTLEGGTGDDVLHGGPGGDTLQGGAGTDTASYAYSEGAVDVTVNGAAAVNTGGDAAGDTLNAIENLTGSDFGDVLIGNRDANVLDGGPGNDVLKPGGGTDRLIGGPGTDRVDYTGSASVTVDLGGVGMRGDAEGDTYTGVEAVTGTAGNDFLTGDAAANTLTGGGGADTLEGLGGADVLQGGSGADMVSYEKSPSGVEVDLSGRKLAAGVGGDAAGDTMRDVEGLTGSAFVDNLIGGTRADTLIGGGGDDLLEGREGPDRLEGGPGTDTAAYVSSNRGVTVSLAGGVPSGGDAAGDSLTDIENLAGSRHADRLTGDGGDNVLEGLAGPDALEGGDGRDTASYEHSDAGVSVRLGLTGPQGGTGHATGDVLSNIENLIGSKFDDALYGNDSNNIFIGGAGADTIKGKPGWNTASYVGSNAGVTVSLARKTPQGGAGHGTGDVLRAINSLVGSAHDDHLTGDVSPNNLDGRAGADVLDGGGGGDTVIYEHSPLGVTVDLTRTGPQISHGHADGDTLINIVSLVGSDHADRLTGTAQGNYLVGGPGDDTLHGGAGADTLVPGPGADTVHGGSGTDSLSLEDSDAGVVLRLDLATGSGFGGHAEGDTYVGIEVIYGSKFNDVIIAPRARTAEWHTYIEGGAGDDVIVGGPDSEIVNGGPGADILYGGPGKDDEVGYGGSPSAVTVNLVDGTASGGDAEGDVVSGFEQLVGSSYDDHLTLSGSGYVQGLGGADTLVQVRSSGAAGQVTLGYGSSNTGVTVDLSSTGPQSGGHAQGDRLVGGFNRVDGSRHGDTLSGTAQADTIAGSGGDDVLNGRGGNDVLRGGPGADTLTCGTGDDAISYEWSDTGVTIDLEANTFSGGEAQGDTATDCESIHGSNGNDTLAGRAAGGGKLYGGRGNDTLKSTAGADTLYGGLGGDRFVFGTGTGTDAVMDFRDGEDRIDVSALGVAGYAALRSRITEEPWQGETSTKIDLATNGGGIVMLRGLRRSSIDASDFVFAE